MRRRVREHRDTFDGEAIRDFVDMYLSAESKSDADPAYTGAILRVYLANAGSKLRILCTLLYSPLSISMAYTCLCGATASLW